MFVVCQGRSDVVHMASPQQPEVGNLPYSTSWQDLKDHMRRAGDVLFCEILQEPGTATGIFHAATDVDVRPEP